MAPVSDGTLVRARQAPADSAAGRPPRRRLTLQRRRSLLGVAVVAPAMAVIAVFFVLPLGLMFWMSLHDWPLLGTHRWVGLDNYTRAFHDSEFLDAVKFTLEYTLVITPVLFFLGLGLALLVNRPGRAARVFQSVYFMPVVIGFASAGYLWLFLAHSSVGPLPDLMDRLGLGQRSDNWFASVATALLVVCAMVTWKITGMQMLLLLSGLQSIPGELKEAARIDGASVWRVFLHVVLPLLRPTLALVLVFSVAGSLLAFDQFYIMTSGGPSNGTITAVYQIYRTSFINFDLGYGAAMSVLLMLVLAAVSAVQMLLLRNSDHG